MFNIGYYTFMFENFDKVAGVAVTFVAKSKKKRATATEYPTTEV